MQFNKAKLLSLAAAIVGVVVCTSGACAQQMREVAYVVVNNLFSTPAYVAAENGYWAKQGLALSASPSRNDEAENPMSDGMTVTSKIPVR